MNLFQITAVDDDGSKPNNHIVYRIESGALDKFIIDVETGVLSIAPGASLDPDQADPRRTNYSLRVIAIDGASGQDQMKTAVIVNITVKDVNNKPPILLSPGTIRIKENIAVSIQKFYKPIAKIKNC